jgi:hypothetical protein
MIVLDGPAPSTSAELTACLRQLLAKAIVTGPQAVAISGDFPAIAKLTIDVTGATPLDHPAATWATQAGQMVRDFTVAALEIIGHLFGTGARQVQIEAAASNCRGEFVALPTGQTALRIAAAKEGRLNISITRASVEAIILAEAGEAAKAQGVEIKGVQLAWQTQGPRNLSAQVQIKAKKGFLPAATLQIRGQLQIDDSLTATISGLSVDGEGFVGNIAAGMIRPRLLKAEGMKRLLLALPLDAIAITDVKLTTTGEVLGLEAAFAG